MTPQDIANLIAFAFLFLILFLAMDGGVDMDPFMMDPPSEDDREMGEEKDE